MLRKTAIFLTIYILICLYLTMLGPWSLCYAEQIGTFFHDAGYYDYVMSSPNGYAQLVGNWIVQYFTTPAAAILLMSLLLAVIAMILGSMAVDVAKTDAMWPLAVAVVMILTLMQYNISYLVGGTVAFLFMALLLWFCLRCEPWGMRLIVAVLSTFLLFMVAGSVAMLFAATVLVTQIGMDAKHSYWYISCAIVAAMLGWACVSLGIYATYAIALTPDCYFAWNQTAPSSVWQPWAACVGLFAVASCWRLISRTKEDVACGNKARWIAAAACAAVCIGVGAFGKLVYVDKDAEAFKQLNYLMRERKWGEIESLCQKLPNNNLLFHNCLNMALAEQGTLADKLFEQPCVDIRDIYLQADKSPYMYMMLSDIYYSMGHMALSRRYAFEANEMMGNYSPRMLQRLTELAIIYGDYAVAKKYLRLLSKTSQYAGWAKDREKYLYDDGQVALSSEYGGKRLCIFPDDRFAANKGLDDDLRQIIRANPQHAATKQYLGSLYLLSRDLPRFMEVVDELQDGERLPRAYQEAVAMWAHAHGDSICDRYAIGSEVKERYGDFNANPRGYPQTLWYFLKCTR